MGVTKKQQTDSSSTTLPLFYNTNSPSPTTPPHTRTTIKHQYRKSRNTAALYPVPSQVEQNGAPSPQGQGVPLLPSRRADEPSRSCSGLLPRLRLLASPLLPPAAAMLPPLPPPAGLIKSR